MKGGGRDLFCQIFIGLTNKLRSLFTFAAEIFFNGIDEKAAMNGARLKFVVKILWAEHVIYWWGAFRAVSVSLQWTGEVAWMVKTAKNGRCRTTQVRTTLWRVFTQKKKMCVVLLTSFTWSYFTLFSYVASCCGDGGRWVVPKQHLLLQPFVRFKEKWGDFGGLFPCSCPAKGDKMGRNEWNAIKKKCPEDLRKARSCGQNASP